MGADEYGTIVSFNAQRGFGFVRPDNGDDCFFHMSKFKDAEDEIAVGKRVAFVRMKDREGRRDAATNVVIMLPVPQL